MIKRKWKVLMSMVCCLAFASQLMAAHSDDAALSAEEAELQAKLEVEYQRALAKADKSQADAKASMERAREQLNKATEDRQQALENRQLAVEDRQHAVKSSKDRQAQRAVMREELNRAHRKLRETSREVSRVNRELVRAKMTADSTNLVFISADRPVLGVILGDSNDVGIKVLGVSPDGPAEQAGIKAGDVIVAMGGRVLVAADETGSARKGLNVALQDIKADEAVIVSVERGSETLDFSVVPEVREPLSWQSVVRFTSATSAIPHVDGTVMIERIIVPEINTVGLAEQIEHMRVEIEQRRAVMEAGVIAPLADINHFEFHFDDMSEMGDFALHDTNAWFGMPLAAGLRLATIEPGLGEYFKTDRGVLILKAKEDNALQLQSGDVVLSLHGTEVNSPAEFMRALRGFEPGDELVIDIKRNRKSKTLKPVIEESETRFYAPQNHEIHQITITTDSD